jgi:hypothetical protein
VQPTKEKPIFCVHCKATFSTQELTPKHYKSLQQRHHWESLNNEWNMLVRVEQIYQQYPTIENLIKDFWQKETEYHQEKWKLKYEGKEVVFERGNFDDSLLQHLTAEDREVIEYLRWHQFSLVPRMEFVQEVIKQMRSAGMPKSVNCPVCKAGYLKIDSPVWRNPNAFYD